MKTTINFNTDNVYELFMDYLQNKENKIFDFLGQGSSKAAFMFFEESTKQEYVVKIEKDFYYEDVLNTDLLDELEFEDIEEDNQCYQQTKKEIETYKWAKENNLDLFLAPILLEHSSADQQFEVMVYCEDLFRDELDCPLRDSLRNSIETTVKCSTYLDTLGGFIADYLIVNKEFSKQLIEELYDIGRELEEINAWFFEDYSRNGNLGLYNGKLVLRDYGYGYME